MNDAGFRGFVPGGERFIQKGFGSLRIFRRHRRFHLAGQRSDFAADLKVMLGVRLGLAMRFERGSMTSCL